MLLTIDAVLFFIFWMTMLDGENYGGGWFHFFLLIGSFLGVMICTILLFVFM